MAGQYSPKQFFRKVSNKFLIDYIERKNIVFDLDLYAIYDHKYLRGPNTCGVRFVEIPAMLTADVGCKITNVCFEIKPPPQTCSKFWFKLPLICL